MSNPQRHPGFWTNYKEILSKVKDLVLALQADKISKEDFCKAALMLLFEY